MKTELTNPIRLKPNELEAVYSISKLVAEVVDLDDALEQIVQKTRDVLVFDSAVVYLLESDNKLEPFFARAIGRGKGFGHRLPWGDMAAKKAIESGKNFISEAKIEENQDRLEQHFYLSLPMIASGTITGALVFIRFGGPKYKKSHINLAEFITAHISQLFERKRLVEKIAALQAEHRLTKLQDEFVAMVSHELKTPLGFIKGYTTTLLRQDTTWDNDTQLEFLKIIDEEADLLSEQIENLLNSYRLKSRSVSIAPQHFPVAPFLQSIVEKLANQDLSMEISLGIDPSELETYADPNLITQVVNNLISNAAKYAPDSELKISVSKIDSGTRFAFNDHGPGIHPDHHQSIFKQFYRVPERTGGVRGAGLGLFICQEIIQAHNGKIWVESASHEGTTFFFDLPNPSQTKPPERDGGYE